MDEKPPVEEPVDEKPPVEEPKRKKNTFLIVLGVVALLILGGAFAYFNMNSVDVPQPPYINEDGTIDWDRKYEEEIK